MNSRVACYPRQEIPNQVWNDPRMTEVLSYFNKPFQNGKLIRFGMNQKG